MESKSPYLEAIQQISGKTPKEKHRSLNKLVQQTIRNKNSPGDSRFQVPDVLEPLIEVEIAKILKNTDDVIVALKSDDAAIVNRALQAEWLFDGTNKSVTNFHYFSTHILPFVSLNTRNKIIKCLSQHLGRRKEYEIAQEFLEGLENTFGYDLKQLMSLLPTCSESYVFDLMKDENVDFMRKMAKKHFPKFPKLAIRYLKLEKPVRQIRTYEENMKNKLFWKMLSKLIKNHLSDFIDIVISNGPLERMKIGNKSVPLFLRNEGIEALVKYPHKFLPMLPLKSVTEKLDEQQFALMFRNLFPETITCFSTDIMLEYLEFQPQEMKLHLMLKTFKDSFGKDLTSSLDKVTSKLLLLLPPEDRVEVAQKKLDSDPEINKHNYEDNWLCYISPANSIPRIKNLISKAQKRVDRVDLVNILIYTCKVNNSGDDWLQVLRYLSTRHRNEIPIFWLKIYQTLLECCKLFTKDHWEVVLAMIQRSHVTESEFPKQLLEEAIRYNLLNSIPIDEQFVLLTEISIRECVTHYNYNFVIFHDNLDFNKHCLEKFIEIIPLKFTEGHPVWKCSSYFNLSAGDEGLVFQSMIKSLLAALYDYNERIVKTASAKRVIVENQKLLSVKNHPWLLEQAKKLLLGDNQAIGKHGLQELKSLLRDHEPELYNLWFPSEEKEEKKEEKIDTLIIDVSKSKALDLLKRNHQTILQNWEKFFQSCKEKINHSHTRRFLKKCTWYSEIPIKFLQECLKNFDKIDPETMKILGLLLRGPEFAEIIKPMVPSSDKMDIEDENLGDHEVISSALFAINKVSPPPPLELVGQFSQGDHLSQGLNCLRNVARQVPVTKVITFAEALINQPISLKKLAVRLMYDVAPTEKLSQFSESLWNTEQHKSIKKIIFEKSLRKLASRPCTSTWNSMERLLQSLTVENVEFIDKFTNLGRIPKHFEKVLKIVIQFEEKGMNRNVTAKMILDLLGSIHSELSASFSEDGCRFLLKRFLFDPTQKLSILEKGRHFAINFFLMEAGDKLESRLDFFHDSIKDLVRKQWNQPHPENPKFYPTKLLFAEIVEDIVKAEIEIGIDMKILESMMELFSSVLKPIEEPISYLSLFFMIEYKKADDMASFGSSIAEQLPKLLDCFTQGIMCLIGESFEKFLMRLMKRDEGNRSLYVPLAQALTEKESIHCYILAAVIINNNWRCYKVDRNPYEEISRKLREVDHPSVKLMLNS